MAGAAFRFLWFAERSRGNWRSVPFGFGRSDLRGSAVPTWNFGFALSECAPGFQERRSAFCGLRSALAGRRRSFPSVLGVPAAPRFGRPIRAARRAGRWRYRKIGALGGRNGSSGRAQFFVRSAFCATLLRGLPRKKPTRAAAAGPNAKRELAFRFPVRGAWRAPRVLPPVPACFSGA